MATKILKVVAQGQTQTIQKQDGSVLEKCPIHLKELGGKYADEYAAVLLGAAAKQRFDQPGTLVAATLYFSTHQYEGNTYQDIAVSDIVKINS